MIINLALFILLVFTVLMCYQESKRRKINFFGAFAICVVTTPLIGYFIVGAFPLRKPRGCAFCGNEKNEAEYCGLCGKDAQGRSRLDNEKVNANAT